MYFMTFFGKEEETRWPNDDHAGLRIARSGFQAGSLCCVLGQDTYPGSN